MYRLSSINLLKRNHMSQKDIDLPGTVLWKIIKFRFSSSLTDSNLLLSTLDFGRVKAGSLTFSKNEGKVMD